MVMLAHLLVDSGAAQRVLVVAGENRLTGQSRDAAVQALAQVGHPEYEVPLGATIPAYYGLVASRWIYERALDAGSRAPDDADSLHWQRELAELAVLMRRHAAGHPGAQFREPIGLEDVMASKAVASPLKLLDCCPVSDGAAAFVVSRSRGDGHAVRIAGTGQAHTHQHISAAPSLVRYGAAESMARAAAAAGFGPRHCRYAAVYDSFTITLAILLEELGLAPAGACPSTPTAACSPTATAAWAAPWRTWPRRTCSSPAAPASASAGSRKGLCCTATAACSPPT